MVHPDTAVTTTEINAQASSLTSLQRASAELMEDEDSSRKSYCASLCLSVCLRVPGLGDASNRTGSTGLCYQWAAVPTIARASSQLARRFEIVQKIWSPSSSPAMERK